MAREINTYKRDDLFVATPPLESLRMILSVCASHQMEKNPAERFLVMSNDIKRAYFYAPASPPIYVAIPDEDLCPGDEGKVACLNLSLYETRDAAQNLSNAYSNHLETVGFARGRASPCDFWHEERRISLTVHGDDFTSTGTERDLRWLDDQLKAKFEVKTKLLGPDAGRGHLQELRVLNRILAWTDLGVTRPTRGTRRSSSASSAWRAPKR